MLLGAGALLASFVGTTGASMLLIRPLLQTNRERKRVAHTVVFFIFLVSNIGGCLTPLGDPPLFLGYLIGVPFLGRCGSSCPGCSRSALVLAVYAAWDRREHAREAQSDLKRDFYEVRPLRIAGKDNLVLLVGRPRAPSRSSRRRGASSRSWAWRSSPIAGPTRSCARPTASRSTRSSRWRRSSPASS